MWSPTDKRSDTYHDAGAGILSKSPRPRPGPRVEGQRCQAGLRSERHVVVDRRLSTAALRVIRGSGFGLLR